MGKKPKVVRVKNVDAFTKTAMYPSSLENNTTGIPEGGRNIGVSTIPTANAGLSVRLEQGKPPVYIDNDTKQEIIDNNVGAQSGPLTEPKAPDHYVERLVPPKELIDKYSFAEIPDGTDSDVFCAEDDESEVSAKSYVGTETDTILRTPVFDTTDISKFKDEHGLSSDIVVLIKILFGFLESRMRPDSAYNTIESVVQLLPTNMLLWAIERDKDWAKLCLTHPNQKVKTSAVKKIFNLTEDIPEEIIDAYIYGFLAASKQ